MAWRCFLEGVKDQLHLDECLDDLRNLWINHVAGRFRDDHKEADCAGFLVWDYAKKLLQNEEKIEDFIFVDLASAEQTLGSAIDRVFSENIANEPRWQARCLLHAHFEVVRFAFGYVTAISRHFVPDQAVFKHLFTAARYFALSLEVASAASSVNSGSESDSPSPHTIISSDQKPEYPGFKRGELWLQHKAFVLSHVADFSSFAQHSTAMVAAGLRYLLPDNSYLTEANFRSQVAKTWILLLPSGDPVETVVVARLSLTTIEGAIAPFVAPDPVSVGLLLTDCVWRKSCITAAQFAAESRTISSTRGYLWSISFSGPREATDMASLSGKANPDTQEVGVFQRSLSLTGTSAGSSQAALMMRLNGAQFNSESVAFSAGIDSSGALLPVNLTPKVVEDHWESRSVHKVDWLIYSNQQSDFVDAVLRHNKHLKHHKCATLNQAIAFLASTQQADQNEQSQPDRLTIGGRNDNHYWATTKRIVQSLSIFFLVFVLIAVGKISAIRNPKTDEPANATSVSFLPSERPSLLYFDFPGLASLHSDSSYFLAPQDFKALCDFTEQPEPIRNGRGQIYYISLKNVKLSAETRMTISNDMSDFMWFWAIAGPDEDLSVDAASFGQATRPFYLPQADSGRRLAVCVLVFSPLNNFPNRLEVKSE